MTMEMRQTQQPRQRSQQREQMTVQARQEQMDEVRQWERDWRTTITTQVSNISESTAQLSLIVREMQGDVRDLLQWKTDVQKRKDDGIEKRPDEWRANLALLISVAGFAIYIMLLISQHWKP